MFSGLEVKASDKKAENDDQQQPQMEGGSSSFSFLQSSISSSAMKDDPTPSSSTAPPAPSGGSSFSFLSSSNAASKANDTSTSIPVSTPAASSGFSFLSSKSAPAPAPEPELVEESPSYMAPNATSAFGFLSSSTSTEPKPSPAPAAPAKESSSSMFSFLSSSITTEPPAPAPASTSATTSAPLDLTGMTTSSSNSSTIPAPSSTQKSEPWGGTNSNSNSNDSKPMLPNLNLHSSGKSGSDILSLANPHQPAGSGIVFGTAAVKKQGIKKRSKTKKVGYTAANASTPSTPSAANKTLPSRTEPPVPPTPTPSSTSISTLPSVDSVGELKQTHSQEEATKRLAQEAEDAARKAEQFMREKLSSSPPTIVTGRYSSNDVTEDYGNSLEPPSSPVGDDMYEAAKAAAQEAQSVAAAAGKKSGAGSVGFMGLFKRSGGGGGGGGGGNVSGANSLASPSPSSHGANGSGHGTNHHDGDDAKKKIEEGLRGMEITEENERDEQERLKLQAMKLEEERLENERLKKEEAERLEQQRQEEEKRKKPILTPQKKLTFLLLEFKSRTDRAVDRVARLRQQRSALLAERATAEKQLELATQQITQAEKQQVAAAEEEDFDLADRLAQVIERYEKEKDDEKRVLKSIDDSIEKVDELSDDVVDSVAQCFVDVQGLLTDFAQEEGGKEKEDGTEVVAKFEVVAKRLAAENERLSADWKNIERDGGFVEEERKELEGTISEQTQDYQVLRKIASEKLAVVDSEVEELKRQLAIKEAEAFQLKKEVCTHDETIAQVRTKFARQLTRLGKKESALSESRREWEAEKLAFTNMKEDHEAEVTAHSEAVIAHDKIMARIKVEVAAAKSLESVIRKEIVVEKSGQSSYTHDGEGAVSNDADSELAGYHAEVVKREAAVDEANQKLVDAQTMIDNLEREILVIDERIPELEAEKKASAAKRDFKSAAKASKEIKEVTAKKKLCQEELEGEALDRREAARVELEKISAELEEKREVAHEKEKEIGKKEMVLLAKKIWRLVAMKKEIIANTTGDDVDEEENTSVTTIGISVLDNEIATMITEGASLGEKFDGWEDILEEVEGELEKDGEGEEEEEIEEKYDEIVDESSEAKDENTENDDMNEEPSSTINAEESEGELEENEELNGEVENGVSTNNDINFEAVSRYKEIIAQQKKFEGDLDDAVVAEDYDKAAEIDEKIQELKDEIDSLGLTQTELDLANDKDVESEEQEVVETLGENKDEQTNRSGDIVEEIESDSKEEMNDDG